jgi:hypothetical protein
MKARTGEYHSRISTLLVNSQPSFHIPSDPLHHQVRISMEDLTTPPQRTSGHRGARRYIDEARVAS